MVFNVSSAADSNKTDFIDGSDVESGNSEKHDGVVLPPYYRRHTKKNRFCIVLPWFLFAICFLMLGFSMCWGWNQHRQLRKLLGDKHQENVHGIVAIPKPSDFDYKRIPYGNDGLFGNYGSSAEDDENDVEIREDVIQLFNENQPFRDPNVDTPSEDVSSFGVITVSLPRFESLGDIISSFLGKFKLDDTRMNPQMNDTDVSPV